MKTKILIIDDYNIFRAGIKLLLEKYDNFNVVGGASNPGELFKKLESINPDVIVMNLMLPMKSIVKISKTLNKKYPKIPYIILAVNASEYAILECVINGASGVIWKESSMNDLEKAVKTVISGEKFLNIPESVLVSRTISKAQNVEEERIEIKGLSNREQEILTCFAQGGSYKEIGEKLNISPRTVETHRVNIVSKLHLHSTADLVKFALKYNLI